MKVVMLTSKYLGQFQEKVIKSLLVSDHTIAGFVIDGRRPASLFKRLIKHLKKKRGGYVFILAFHALFGRKEAGFDVESFADDNAIAKYVTQDPYSHDTIEVVRSFQADVGVYLGGFGSLLKDPYLNLYRHGVLSYHHGNMRKYRGQPPCFWELYNNEKEVGITVQRLTERLDAGAPIEEITVPIEKNDSLEKLTQKCYLHSVPMMVKALDQCDSNTDLIGNISELGRVYTLPNLRQWIILKTKLFARNFISYFG